MRIILAVLLLFSMNQTLFAATVECSDESVPFYVLWFSSDTVECEDPSLDVADVQTVISDQPIDADENQSLSSTISEDTQTDDSMTADAGLQNVQETDVDEELSISNSEESDPKLLSLEDQISTLSEDISLLKADKGRVNDLVEETARELSELRTEIRRIDQKQDQNIAAEKDARTSELNGLKDQISSLKSEIDSARRIFDESNSALEQALTKKIDDVNGQLKLLIEDTQDAHTNKSAALETEISDLNKNQLALVIGLSVIILTFFIALFFTRKQSTKNVSELKQHYEDLRLQLNSDLTEVDQHVVALCEELSSRIVGAMEGSKVQELDHSLVIKVADELVRIEKNLSRMDQKTKGLKQLKASVGRIKDNVLAHGYEIVDMLGMKYNEGMKVQANFIEDGSLDEGTELISKVIKPQINFKGAMIQSAQVEVSQGI